MGFLSMLWMPIVVSAIILFVASSIIHMVLPTHKGEWKGLPDEAKFGSAVEGVEPGNYMFPWGHMSDMKSPEFIEKMKNGPNGTLVLWPSPTNMGKNLGLMFLYFLVVGVFVSYVSFHALPTGTPYLKVFQVCGAAAFMAHGLGWMPQQIWFGRSRHAYWAYLIDAVIYALLTAGTFGWLWPK